MENEEVEKRKHPKLYKFLIVVGIIISTTFLILVLAWGTLSVVKFGVYNEFYSLKTDVASIPGIKDGFIPQGVIYLEDDINYALVGTMKDNSTNKLYVVDKNNMEKSYSLVSDGLEFKAQTMDIAYINKTIYLTNEKKEDNEEIYGLYSFTLDNVNEENHTIDIGKRIEISSNICSFLFSDKDYLYIGENKEDNSGILAKYKMLDILSNVIPIPLDIYELPPNSHGAVIDSNSTLILLSNINMSDTYFNFYDLNEVSKSENKINGKTTSILNESKRSIKAPMLLDGLDLNTNQDKILIVSKAGTSAYVFGSMFYSNKIRELKIK